MKLITPEKIITAFEENAIFPFHDTHPGLGIIIKEDASPDEKSYLKSLVTSAEKYDGFTEVREVKDAYDAFEAVKELKGYHDIHGIIILSNFGSASRALASEIPPRLDIDCTNYLTLGMLMGTTSAIGYRLGPCAPIAVMKILEYENIDLTGKKVAILGRSLRVGRPLAEILSLKNATVTVFHSKSEYENLSEYDIVISAIGKPKEITYQKYFEMDSEIQQPEDLKTILIDVGINTDKNGKICGDFDLESFKDTNVSITPVPGCVGRVATIVMFGKLFVNAAEQNGRPRQ